MKTRLAGRQHHRAAILAARVFTDVAPDLE